MVSGISLADKCQLLFGAAVVAILAAALAVPWFRTPHIVREGQFEVARQLADAWLAGEIQLGQLERQRGAPVRPGLGTPETTRARIVIVDKPGTPQTQLRVASIGAARSSPDFRALQVMNNALGGLFSGRINMNLRERRGYSYGTYSQFVFRRSPGPFVVAGGAAVLDVEPLLLVFSVEFAETVSQAPSG